ncbi:MAG: single-stranded DNA-binding protein [Clostridiales bacterium]|nr:single-stranded DNA-binding protein [Clostridiales bacterium]
MNKLIIIGNLTADPELRTIPSGINVCTFTVAVNRRFQSNKDERQTDFFRVAAWRQLGENCSRFLTKGKKVCVIGEVSARAFEGKDGTLRASLEVTADEVEFLSPRDSQEAPARSSGYQPQPAPAGDRRQQGQGWNNSQSGSMNGTAFGDIAGGFSEITDSDLPF